jgi:hypothetical protein
MAARTEAKYTQVLEESYESGTVRGSPLRRHKSVKSVKNNKKCARLTRLNISYRKS